MTQPAVGSGAETPPLDDLLRGAKFALPNARRPGVVGRENLIKVARDSGKRVVGITAPAGYGKTTLLAQWADSEDRLVGYISFDRFDNDPVRLMTLLASAYSRMSPANAEAVADVAGPGASVLGRSAPGFAALLRASEVPFVLMLDDLHELNSPECHDALGVIMPSVPHQSQVVTASRYEQPHIPWMRASGEAIELGAAELALDASGVQEVFAAQQVSVSPEQASLVAQRTEGWAAGLHLVALIASERDSDDLAVSGDDRYLADFLYDQSLKHLSEDVQTFLRRTAILDELSGPLCDAVLGSSGSHCILRHLDETHMFLVPLDRRREWYRYHDLFREFLFGELRRLEPDVIGDLHGRAADWYETNGVPAKAVEHLLHTRERRRCAELIAAVGLSSYQAGEMATLARWMSELGEEAIREYPPLAVISGDVALLRGRTAEAERWMTIVESISYDGVPGDGTASFDSSKAIFSAMLCQHGPDQMLADARLALDEEPPWSLWRDTALDVCAQAHLLLGDREKAQELFEETSSLAEACGNTDNFVVAESELAILAMDRGAWDEAEQYAGRALDTVKELQMHDYAISLIAFASNARMALHRGDRERAHRLLAEGMRARQFCTAAMPYLAVRGRLQLANVWLALADMSSANHLLREINDILHVRPMLGALVEEVDKFRARISSTSAHALGATPLTAAELRLLPFLQTHLALGEIAERLFVSRNTVRTQVASIYRKLGVGSRSDAVDKANEVGLLGG